MVLGASPFNFGVKPLIVAGAVVTSGAFALVDGGTKEAGAEELVVMEEAVIAPVVEDGAWNNGFGGGANAFFSSSNFLRNLAIASASRSCFSHFEYDLD